MSNAQVDQALSIDVGYSFRFPGTVASNSIVVGERPTRVQLPPPGGVEFAFDDYTFQAGGIGDGVRINIAYQYPINRYLFLNTGLGLLRGMNNEPESYYRAYQDLVPTAILPTFANHAPASTQNTHSYTYSLWFGTLRSGLGALFRLEKRSPFSIGFGTDLSVGYGVLDREVYTWVEDASGNFAELSLNATNHPYQSTTSEITLGLINYLEFRYKVNDYNQFALVAETWFQNFKFGTTTFSSSTESFEVPYSDIDGDTGYRPLHLPLNSISILLRYYFTF